MKRLALTALVLLAPLAALAQDELPKRYRDEIDTARVAAEQGDAGPAVQAIAAVGSAQLTRALRDTLAVEFLELGDELSSLKIHGAALDVYRAVARTFADTSAAHEATNNLGETFVKLGDRAAALKVFAALVAPPPPGISPPLAVAREESRATTLGRLAKQLERLSRPAEAFVAYLDAVLVEGLGQWEGAGNTLSGSLELSRALSSLLGRTADDVDQDALDAALALARLQPLRDADGAVYRLHLDPATFLETVALVHTARKQPKRATEARRLKQRFAKTRRVYRLPRASRFHLSVLQAAQARFDRQRALVSKLEQRARAGDRVATYLLGEALLEGRVTPLDYPRGKRLIAKAGKLGHGPALLHLASDARTEATRAHLAAQALAAGQAGALRILNRTPVPLTAKARVVARRLARAGSGPAWLALAGDSQVDKDQRRFLRRAVLCGDARAYLRLAEHEVEQGAADPAVVSFWRRCAVLSSRYGPEIFWPQANVRGGAWRARLTAAAKRYPAAGLELAWSSAFAKPPRLAEGAAAALRGIQTWAPDLHGPPTPFTSPVWYVLRKDRTLAPKLQAVLAKRTDPLAKHLYAGAFSNGKLGLKVDLARATQLHREESRARQHVCTTLWSLLSGSHRARLAAAERAWARKASAAGDAWAETYLGLLHWHGYGGPTDLDAARACLLRAAKRGSRLAYRALADQEIDLEEAEGKPRPTIDAHLRRAGELGDRFAWVLLAGRLGRRGAAKDAAAAWTQAVAAGAATAIVRAARPHLLSDPADLTQALPLLRKAAAAGSIEAYLQLLVVLREHPTLRVVGDP